LPNNHFDPADWIIPAFDADAKTLHLNLNVHPGQVRILDYLTACDHLPFRNRDDVIRWCIAYGGHTLLGPLPSTFALIEAKTNILHDERFQAQKDCLAESVQKYLARGENDLARRIVTITFEDYSQIGVKYWRNLWLSTLQSAIEMLEQRGIRVPVVLPQDLKRAHLLNSLDDGVAK
jgi:hypothetical protein